MPNPVDNAIPEDASAQLENQTSGADDNQEDAPYVNPRMAAMEAIAAGRRESLNAELKEGGSTVQIVDEDADNGDAEAAAARKALEAEPDPEPTPEPEPDQLAAQLAADERPVTPVADTTLVKVKVDGVEMELPLADVVKSYQKDAAATRRLQEATRLLAIAEQKANIVAQAPEVSHNITQPPAAPDDPATQEARLGQIKVAFSKLYEGDEEGAAKAMLELMGQGAKAQPAATPTVDPLAIADLVTQQLEVKSAYAAVQQDYPAVFAEDERGMVLGKAALDRMTAKEAQGTPRHQALKEATEEVATLFGIQKAGRQEAPAPRTARDEKLARKAALDVPSAASVVAGGTSSPAEAPNVSSVIAQMAKARLGQSMNPR